MTRRKNNEYYAVIRGYHITTPTIFSSWGDAHPLITGFPNALHAAFQTLPEAQQYMNQKGVALYECVIKHDAGNTSPVKNHKAYYAVASGRSPGIKEYYYGRNGIEPQVAEFPHACFKHFRTETQAKAFISDWIEMSACVAKDNITKALLAGHRPTHNQRWTLRFEWQKDSSQIEQDTISTFEGLRLVDSGASLEED